MPQTLVYVICMHVFSFANPVYLATLGLIGEGENGVIKRTMHMQSIRAAKEPCLPLQVLFIVYG